MVAISSHRVQQGGINTINTSNLCAKLIHPMTLYISDEAQTKEIWIKIALLLKFIERSTNSIGPFGEKMWVSYLTKSASSSFCSSPHCDPEGDVYNIMWLV